MNKFIWMKLEHMLCSAIMPCRTTIVASDRTKKLNTDMGGKLCYRPLSWRLGPKMLDSEEMSSESNPQAR